ncbi:hypothetical protein U1Q18_036093 [Sarracenia purpurea var. burkii]
MSKAIECAAASNDKTEPTANADKTITVGPMCANSITTMCTKTCAIKHATCAFKDADYSVKAHAIEPCRYHYMPRPMPVLPAKAKVIPQDTAVAVIPPNERYKQVTSQRKVMRLRDQVR